MNIGLQPVATWVAKIQENKKGLIRTYINKSDFEKKFIEN